MITIRQMPASELARLGEIDRSEHVSHEYVYRDRLLEKRVIDLDVPPWSPSGDHEHRAPSRVDAWRQMLDRGGKLVGALDAETLVGVAIYRPDLPEGMANLAVLYVSRSHRRNGIASRLAGEVARLARADGAGRLYVSATPSVSTVEFYRSQGYEVTDEPDETLFALEPDDIHMILEL